MRGVGEGIDDGNCRMPRKFFDGCMREGAYGEGVNVLARDPREVGDALAAAESDIFSAQKDRIPTQVRNRCLEADAGAQRGLLEHQPERPPGQKRVTLAPLVLAL